MNEIDNIHGKLLVKPVRLDQVPVFIRFHNLAYTSAVWVGDK